MSADPQIADRLAKLLRLACCKTSPDGERLAAVNRLSATVAAHDVDWDRVLNDGSGFSRDQLQTVFDEGYRQGVADTRQELRPDDWAPAGRSRTDEIGNRIGELKFVLDAAVRSKNDGKLAGWYADFASDMRSRLNQWGRSTFVSEKQWHFLNNLRSIFQEQGYLNAQF